jgi:hypothetical protein
MSHFNSTAPSQPRIDRAGLRIVLAVLGFVALIGLFAAGSPDAPRAQGPGFEGAQAPRVIEDWRGNSASFRPAE